MEAKMRFQYGIIKQLLHNSNILKKDIMSQRSIFQEPECIYATGLVKPKTTSLFFEKIWVPEEYVEEYDIPKSVCLPYLGECEKIYKNAIPRNSLSAQIIDRELTTPNAYLGIEHNYYLKELSYRFENEMRNAYRAIAEEYVDKHGFLTSFHRNEALRIISNHYYRNGYNLVPIFLEKTDFEKSLMMKGPINHSPFSNEFIQRLYQKTIPSQNITGIEATIHLIPLVVEASLTWEQVIDIRRDDDAVKKLRRFKQWASIELNNKPEDEIVNIISKELDDYKYALKKHGIQTVIGSFTTILSSTSTIIQAIEGNQGSLLGAGLSISALIATYAVQQFYELSETKRKPIAYIYDITNIA